jgi:hypothetical protein
METGGFYGGQAASSGAAFDPLQFVMRPMVILKAVCWVSEKSDDFFRQFFNETAKDCEKSICVKSVKAI